MLCNIYIYTVSDLRQDSVHGDNGSNTFPYISYELTATFDAMMLPQCLLELMNDSLTTAITYRCFYHPGNCYFRPRNKCDMSNVCREKPCLEL